MKPFATSSSAASWARSNALGPVAVLLEQIRKPAKAKTFELWLHTAELTINPESVSFDVVPVRRISQEVTQ